jgi:putative peptide zinc metalloprotease protein
MVASQPVTIEASEMDLPPGHSDYQPESQAAPAFSLSSRLSFSPLSVVPEGEEFLVGDPQSGVFLTIPEVGVVALRVLQAGGTIAEAGIAAGDHAGEVVDVVDFASVLVEAGLVSAVNGAPIVASTAPQRRAWLDGVRTETVRPLFSRFAWTFYGLCFAFCLLAFLLEPQLWPSFEDFYFYPDPAVCMVIMLVTSLLLQACHELYHLLAGRAVGVAARFNISRRLFFPVFETDLSQLWSVPRQQRYSPFLAGMAFDCVVLAICLALRLLLAAGLLDMPPLLYRFAGAVVLVQVVGLGFQALIFMRTDLYAVLITALGCYNLYRVNTLYLKSKVRSLRPGEATELASAHPRDLQVARWFAWLYAVGLLWAIYFFVTIFIPNTVIVAGWMLGSLTSVQLGTPAFWEAMTIGLVAALQGLLPLAILLWQRFQRRKGVPT